MYQNDLKRYLDDLAAQQPAPGGGSAAALVGATGVGLISMVANFTIGQEKYRNFESEIKTVLSSSEALREKFRELIDEDVAGYKKISRAFKLPKENAEEKQKRAEAIQEGLKQALGPPLEVCKCCQQAIKLCPALAEKGNVNLITDVGVAALLLQAAFQAALLNVDINLKALKDGHFIAEIREVLEPLEAEVTSLSQAVIAEIKKHLTI